MSNAKALHSHAHEFSVPGTVDLSVKEGDATATFGQAFFPVPSNDPNDPLLWPQWRKHCILAACIAYSFLGCSTVLAPSVYIVTFIKAFGVEAGKAADLTNYCNLAYGCGSLVLVPCYMKFGRRPVMLGTMLIFLISLIGSATSSSYHELLSWRIISGFASGVCEAIPVQLISDVYFLHQRGTAIALYTLALCLGSASTLEAGYMLNGGLSWRLFFVVVASFTGALLVFTFLFVEETKYKRVYDEKTVVNESDDAGSDEKGEGEAEARVEQAEPVKKRKTYRQQLSLWSGSDPEVSALIMPFRAFTYLLVPQVVWVCTTYGLYIGLGGLAFSFTFSTLIVQPPYNWSTVEGGLSAIATYVAYACAVIFTPLSDAIAGWSTRRNKGIREAEMRLPFSFLAMIVGPCGLILYGVTAENKGPWIRLFFGIFMDQWSAFFMFATTLNYCVDSYRANTAEMLILMNCAKQLISFGLSFRVLDWVIQDGYAVVISGAFTAVLFMNNFVGIIFYFWGKRIRTAMSKGWVAAMHGRSITAGQATH